MNLITPAGNKIRVQSKRAFVLIADDTDVKFENGVQSVVSSARIVQRSDSLGTLITAKSRKGNRAGSNGSSTVLHIMSNVTGEVVR